MLINTLWSLWFLILVNTSLNCARGSQSAILNCLVLGTLLTIFDEAWNRFNVRISKVIQYGE